MATNPLLAAILGKLTTPPTIAPPALSQAGIDQEVNARTSGLQDLVHAAQGSRVQEPQPRLIDSIIRAIAGAAAVGTSADPSAALQNQLIQQQAAAERRLAREQAQRDKEFQAQTAVITGKQKAREGVQAELREDKEAIRKRQEAEAMLTKRQEFERELEEFKVEQAAKAATLSAERAQALERLRQKDNITATMATTTTKLVGDDVDGEFVIPISEKIVSNVPLTKEEQDALDRAREHRLRSKLASAAARSAGNEKLTLPKIAQLHRAFYESERAKKVPAVYEDPTINPNAEYKAVAGDARKQPGMPVMQGILRNQPVFRNLDKEAAQKAYEYAQSLALASEDPTVVRRVNEFYGPKVDLTSLGPLQAKAERILALKNSKGYTTSQLEVAIDKMNSVSPEEKTKLKAFFNSLP